MDLFDDLFPIYDAEEKKVERKENAIPLPKECPECGEALQVTADPHTKGTYRSCVKCKFYTKNLIGNVHSYLRSVMTTMAFKSLSWCPICEGELEDDSAKDAWNNADKATATPYNKSRSRKCRKCEFEIKKQGFSFTFTRYLGEKIKISQRNMLGYYPTSSRHSLYGKFNYEKMNWELSIPSINFKREIENVLEIKKYDIDKISALMALK